MSGAIFGVSGPVVGQAPGRPLRARFDSAETNEENRRHWAAADGLSADAAAAPGIRRTLRNRARYEVANNTYARGIVNTLANDCVGTGARLQMIGLKSSDGRLVEREFMAWANAIDLPEKLRTMRISRAVDGEAFGLLTDNPRLSTTVKLDLRLVEAEQISSTFGAVGSMLGPNRVDGITFDAHGNPLFYDVLPQHPGGAAFVTNQPVEVPANGVLHFFLPERPGQRRGIPELTPALPLFAQLRRWTLSVLAAAETAADFAAILYSDGVPDESEPGKPFDRVEFERRAMVTMPAGWKVEQMRAEQPTSTYSDVKHEILAEIARCLSVPFNVAAGNSSSYNYASGRLDHQTYFKSLRVDRSRLITQVLDRIFLAWRSEAVLIEGYLPQSLRTIATDWTHNWFFDGTEHVDPAKEASAQAQRLASMTTTLSDEWGRQGCDWEEKVRQIAKERTLLATLGLSEAEGFKAPSPLVEEPEEVPRG